MCCNEFAGLTQSLKLEFLNIRVAETGFQEVGGGLGPNLFAWVLKCAHTGPRDSSGRIGVPSGLEKRHFEEANIYTPICTSFVKTNCVPLS